VRKESPARLRCERRTEVILCRRLRAQTLTVSFKKPFDLLAETNERARSAPDDFSQTSKWWWLLDKVRTFFDQNPL